jgi:hypothetical protein
MMIRLLVLVAAATALFLYFMPPSMPLYTITNIRIKSLKVDFSGRIQATVQAGIEIQNDNILGADLHSTVIDLYYPDWNGDLQNLGYVKETRKESTSNASCQEMTSGNGKEDDRGVCLSDKGASELPFFSIGARTKSKSHPEAITVHIRNIDYKTYLNMLKDAIYGGGYLEIIASGVAHVKSPMGIPLSLGIICDNALNILQFPLQVVGKACVVEGISSGWAGLAEMGAEVRTRVMRTHKDKLISILKAEEERNMKEIPDADLDKMISISEEIINWHNF